MNAAEWKNYIGNAIREALMGEVRTSPKPGLVDQIDCGAHTDMDLHTFERSTEAIAPYLTDMFMAGFAPEAETAALEIEELETGEDSDAAVDTADAGKFETEEEQLFQKIRHIGVEAENAMFAATEGVNTHKGMLFTMGIVLAAAGLHFRREYSEEALAALNEEMLGRVRLGLSAREGEEAQTGPFVQEVLWLCQDMCSRSIGREFQDMEKREPVTHGERLFREYGERGIRGQAEQGFPILRETAFPEMEKYRAPLSELRGGIRMHRLLWREMSSAENPWESEVYLNAVNLQVLLRIMSELNDTNVVTRSSYAEMKELQEESRRILGLGGGFTEQGMEALLALNQKCIQRNISPGGAADILAVSILLWRLQELSLTLLAV